MDQEGKISLSKNAAGIMDIYIGGSETGFLTHLYTKSTLCGVKTKPLGYFYAFRVRNYCVIQEKKI